MHKLLPLYHLLLVWRCGRPAGAVSVSGELKRLIPREDASCGGDGSLAQCGAAFPSSFCCPASTKCVPIKSDNQSVICCPASLDCTFIKPITCDVGQQNATAFPGNQIHAADLSAKLPTCGDACCPQGYKCDSGACALIRDTSAPSSSPTTTAPASASPTSPAGASQAPEPTTAPGAKSGSKYSGRAVVLGLFCGILLALLLVGALFYYLRRKSMLVVGGNTAASPSSLTSLGPQKTRNVSEPMAHPLYGHRTDFLRSKQNSSSPPPARTPDHHSDGRHSRSTSGGSGLQKTPENPDSFSFTYTPQQHLARPGASPPSHARTGTSSISAQSGTVYSNNSPTPAPPAVPRGLQLDTRQALRRSRHPRIPIRALFTRTPSPAQSLRRSEHNSSFETIDVLMRPPTGRFDDSPHGDASNKRNTGMTTFSAIMEGAGGSKARK